MRKSQNELQADLLAAIAHPNRIRILERLRDAERCNCELGPELGLEQSNLSRHLKLLELAGVLVSRKEGLRVFFKVTDARVYKILELSTAITRRAAIERAEAVEAA